MITMAVSGDDVHVNENIELIHWLYYMIVYYVLQMSCVITVRIKNSDKFLISWKISICN